MLASTDDLLHRQQNPGGKARPAEPQRSPGGRWSKGKYHRLAVLTFKLAVVRDIMLHTGFNVSDVDIALLADPWWPHVANSVRIEGRDYIYQQNPHFCCPPDFGCGFSKSYDGNTGLSCGRGRGRSDLLRPDPRRAEGPPAPRSAALVGQAARRSSLARTAFPYHDTTANWRPRRRGPRQKRTRLEDRDQAAGLPPPPDAHQRHAVPGHEQDQGRAARSAHAFGLAHPSCSRP